MTGNVDQQLDFYSRLAAPGRSPEIPESADVYGWLCGSWDLDVVHYRAIDVRSKGMRGEVHAGWVLEGRAVQDVWIMPRGAERSANADKTINDIVQLGTRADGTQTRWRFTEITPDSFHWLGEALQPDGTTWKLEGEFRAKRRT
jgi:hypothetical protein